MSLHDRRDIVALRRTMSTTDSGALHTLVEVAFTSSQQPGARLLRTGDGRTAGTAFGDTDAGAYVLTEPTGTDESEALLEALEATLAGHARVVATCLPTNGPLTRIVIDALGDVLFASDALPTEDIVDLRHVARRVPHASRHRVGPYDLFVEHL